MWPATSQNSWLPLSSCRCMNSHNENTYAYLHIHARRRSLAAGQRMKLKTGPQKKKRPWVLKCGLCKTGLAGRLRSDLVFGDRATTAVPPCCRTQPQWQQTKGSRYLYWMELFIEAPEPKPASTVHVKHKFVVNTSRFLCIALILANTQSWGRTTGCCVV